MELTRRILNTIFWIAVTIGGIWLLVMSLGGGFPMSLSTSEATIKWDISYMGWELLDPTNGKLKIDFDNKKEGWACLKLDYRPDRKRPPGIYCTHFGFEALLQMKFWLKARNKCLIGVRLKDKKGELEFLVPVEVGTKWVHYTLKPDDYKQRSGYSGRLDTNRFSGYIEFRDMTRNPSFKENTLWLDTLYIHR